MEVGGQRHSPAALPPGKTRYPSYRRLGGPKGRSGRVRKILPQRDSIPDGLARSESLYRLRYPGPHFFLGVVLYILKPCDEKVSQPGSVTDYLMCIVFRKFVTT